MSLTCYKSYSMNVSGCDVTTDWISAPGTCRLRIKNYNPADWTASTLCFNARLGVVAPWDGTFSNAVFVVFPQPSFSYEIDLLTFQTDGGVYFGSAGTCTVVYNAAVPRWRMSLSYQLNDLSDGGRWVGNLAGTSPIGIYTASSRCNGGLPATVELEGYPP